MKIEWDERRYITPVLAISWVNWLSIWFGFNKNLYVVQVLKCSTVYKKLEFTAIGLAFELHLVTFHILPSIVFGNGNGYNFNWLFFTIKVLQGGVVDE